LAANNKEVAIGFLLKKGKECNHKGQRKLLSRKPSRLKVKLVWDEQNQ
jgi:hypothetical protein